MENVFRFVVFHCFLEVAKSFEADFLESGIIEFSGYTLTPGVEVAGPVLE